MNILSATMGCFSPRFRTLSEWSAVYDSIISDRPLSNKTLQGRRASIRCILKQFGNHQIGSIQPREIVAWLRHLREQTPTTARRVLYEICEMFNEAMKQGWAARNPASCIRQHPIKIMRSRLTLEQWTQMFMLASISRPGWVPLMLSLALVTGQRRGDLVKMRFEDVKPRKLADGHIQDCLHVTQQKTGRLLALPTTLKLNIVDISIADIIEQCKLYAPSDGFLLRKSNGQQLCEATLTQCFSSLFRDIHGTWTDEQRSPPTLHECRSLSERLYRAQGIDTRVLLGHTSQAVTDLYNKGRGLPDDYWVLNDTSPVCGNHS